MEVTNISKRQRDHTEILLTSSKCQQWQVPGRPWELGNGDLYPHLVQVLRPRDDHMPKLKGNILAPLPPCCGVLGTVSDPMLCFSLHPRGRDEIGDAEALCQLEKLCTFMLLLSSSSVGLVF